jgi:hypothetical protein
LRDDEAANEEEASADVQLAADGDKGQSPPPQTDDEDIPF